ncbi:ACT domain-containing protein [Allofustis seminis]|uniref:ACT domain-containing protein n=1 Tax=Allofustis seminis TaxID=166939 RepID=UPI0003677E36|nr:ACT domain-containing protein [Allofustis seminis]
MEIKIVLTTFGLDKKGIIAEVSRVLLAYDANILDISQTIVDGYFNMMMIAQVAVDQFEKLSDELEVASHAMGVTTVTQRADTFKAMHHL